jgi:CHAT domain-containing protein
VLSVVPRASVPAQRPLVESRLRDGYRSLLQWSPAGTARAAGAFRQSLEKSRALGLIDLEVDSLVGLAEARREAGTSAESLDLLGAAAKSAQAIGDGRRFVLASARLASRVAALGQPGRPEARLEPVMTAARERGFALGVAHVHLAQGDVHYARSELGAALTEYEAALDAFARLGNAEGVIESHLGLGCAAADLSQDPKARTHFEQARDLARAGDDRRREALALRLLGNVFAKMTQEVEAIRSFEAAETLFAQADDRVALVALYNGLGELHGRLNDLAIAIQYHRRAEALARASGMQTEQAAALLEIGTLGRRLGRTSAAARSYERARALFEAVGDARMAAVALAGLGNVAADEGRTEFAVERLQSALRTVRGAGEARLSAGMLCDLAEIDLGRGRARASREEAQEASRLAAEAGDPLREARAFELLARAARQQGADDEARQLLERSLRIGEEVRTRVPGHELRALFFEELDSRYRLYVDLLMAGHGAGPADRLALAASERGRARVLLDRFRSTSAPGDAPDPERGERERALRDEVRSRALQEDLGTHPRSAQGEAALAEKLAELRRAQGVDSFSEAEARTFDAARIEELQAQLAVPGTLLLELCLGPERSYLWTVSRDRLVVHTLPPRDTLERQAQELYTLLTERQRDLEGSPSERRARAEARDALFYRKGARLSRELLGPIEGLDAFERLVVVSDGLLNYVPLSALPDPHSAPDGDYRPLVLSHEIVRVPSLAAMAALSERAARRASRAAGGPASALRLAVLADPVFTADDPRVSARGPSPGGSSLRGAPGSLASLPRLLASREEAASIAKVARGAEVTVTTGFRVDRAGTEKALGGSYDVVHLATHGVLNDEHPMLSGIVTSLVDAKGRPQDGFLRTQDIYESHVAAELVVLSACETALGKLLRGEGITGLVHAFLRAGADTVVASDWRVDDSATEQLMTELYRGMFVDGASVSAALRTAQIKLLRQRATRAPFYWAAFEAHGLAARLASGSR